jgi:O-antigen/teichoic acid export membrane protein
VIELGLDFWVTKKSSIDKTDAYTASLIAFRYLSAVLTGFVFYFIGVWFGYAKLPLALFLSGALVLNLAHFYSCYLRGIEKLSVEAILSIVRTIFFVAMAGLGIYLGFEISWIALSYLVANVIYGLFTWHALKKYQFALSNRSSSFGAILRVTMPVWISALLLGLSIKLDIILLGELADADSVARYSAAARIFEGCLLLATAFVLTLFPKLSREAADENSRYDVTVFNYGKLLLLIAICAAGLAGVIGGYSFTFFFGENYQSSVQVFVILMVLLPISTLVVFFYNALIIAQQSAKTIVCLCVAVLINVVLDFILIPSMAINGALTAFICKELFLLLCFGFLIYRSRSYA